MRSLVLLGVVAATVLLSGCPLSVNREAPELPPPDAVGGGMTQPPGTTDAGTTGTVHPALDRSRPDDYPVLEPILAYLEEGRAEESTAGLETAEWVSHEDVMEQDMSPEDVGEDAMIYKIVEEDAWLSVLFGPPFSEFYLEFRLAVSEDGPFEVIGCELLPELGEE